MLKYLGEEGERVSDKIHQAYAVSVPIELRPCAHQLASGFNRIYSYHFMTLLRKKVKKLAQMHDHAYLKSLKLKELKTFIEFDDKVTAPLSNFANNEEYWSKASAKPYLDKIRVPTKLINAKDDPFLCNHSCYPTAEDIENPYMAFEYPDTGGHIGTISVL